MFQLQIALKRSDQLTLPDRQLTDPKQYNTTNTYIMISEIPEHLHNYTSLSGKRCIAIKNKNIQIWFKKQTLAHSLTYPIVAQNFVTIGPAISIFHIYLYLKCFNLP